MDKKILGVVNITPDSFSDGGQFFSVDKALAHAEQLIKDGADALDIGAESSRPGADSVSVEEEIRRLKPFLTYYTKHFDTPLSLDTYKSEVAALGLEHNVWMINDITGLTGDKAMLDTVSKSDAVLCLMHMQKRPDTMQDAPEYYDVVTEVYDFLKAQTLKAKDAGVHTVVVDPGIGFGKTLEHNLSLLRDLDRFCDLGPVLIGTSRKSFIGAITGEAVSERLEGTLASNLWAYQKGASLFRVHDVVSFKKALQVFQAIEG
jgi:dihydropteroate synthase